MRVLLIHNPKAGDRKHSKKQLMASLARCGHQAFYQSIKEQRLEKGVQKASGSRHRANCYKRFN